MQIEYIRSLHSNYQRILLEEKPEERRYQYCILNRGGIKGLLPCSLRYLNGDAYLYYDITSRQNIEQLFQRDPITREWVIDFVEHIRILRQELNRFLLQEENILWVPEQIYQDLERNTFSFAYVPYYRGENTFMAFASFLVEHIQYEDEALVEWTYQMYEQLERTGIAYLEQQIFEDLKKLTEADRRTSARAETAQLTNRSTVPTPGSVNNASPVSMQQTDALQRDVSTRESVPPKKGFFSRFSAKRNREKQLREAYRQEMIRSMEGITVAENPSYIREEVGQTMCLDQLDQVSREPLHRLYSTDGKVLMPIAHQTLLIGKSKEKVDLCLEDVSVSRMHAKIVKDKEGYFLEDLNSTNGTYINNKRMQPYERRVLEPGDEILCGRIALQYR